MVAERIPGLVPPFYINPREAEEKLSKACVISRPYLKWNQARAGHLSPDELLIDLLKSPKYLSLPEDTAYIKDLAGELNTLLRKSFCANKLDEVGFSPEEVEVGIFYQEQLPVEVNIQVLGIGSRVWVEAGDVDKFRKKGNIFNSDQAVGEGRVYRRDFEGSYLNHDGLLERSFRVYQLLRKEVPELEEWGLHLELVVSDLGYSSRGISYGRQEGREREDKFLPDQAGVRPDQQGPGQLSLVQIRRVVKLPHEGILDINRLNLHRLTSAIGRTKPKQIKAVARDRFACRPDRKEADWRDEEPYLLLAGIQADYQNHLFGPIKGLVIDCDRYRSQFLEHNFYSLIVRTWHQGGFVATYSGPQAELMREIRKGVYPEIFGD